MSAPSAEPVARSELEVRVQALFQQGVVTVIGLPVVAACLVAAMWPYAPAAVLFGWFAATLTSIALRVPVLLGYRRDAHRLANSLAWAQRYTWAVIAHGLCWAVAPFLLLDPAQPLGVTSYVLVAALMPTTSIPTQSNHPPAMYWIVSLAIVPMILRLVSFFDMHYVPLYITVCFYFVFLIVFARLQDRMLGAGIRLRLENAGLVEALKAQRDLAQAQRERADLANRAKSQFLAAASHDMRQPLHALGLLGASLRELAKEPDKRAVVENMFGAIDALESTFSELLDLSRIDAGYLQPQPVHFALTEIFERLRAYYAPAAGEKGLAMTLAADDAIVYTDKSLLERLLSNLLANAIRYTDAGTVTVEARVLPGGQVQIEVRDSGVGIAAEFRERVFDEFFQLHNPERDRRKGLGLGLAIVRRIATLLEHPLELDSEPGKGTCVRLRVPSGERARIRADAPEATAPLDVLQGKGIVVIEDEAGVAAATADLLRRWGCVVWVAGDGAQALRVLDGRQPDLIVADYRLRDGATGVEAIALLRARLRRDVAALIVTGDTAVERLLDLKAKALPVLHKPVRPAQLRAALSQLLSQAAH